jgi:hypothetical protein
VRSAPSIDGQLADWKGIPKLRLGERPGASAEIQAAHNGTNIYLAVKVPSEKRDEVDESAFPDGLQIGLARRLSATDFSSDFLRLGLSAERDEARNRTPGYKRDGTVAGIRVAHSDDAASTVYEVAIPLRLLKPSRPGREGGLILNLSFPVVEAEASGSGVLEPAANTFDYQVRYGSGELVPVYFLELGWE